MGCSAVVPLQILIFPFCQIPQESSPHAEIGLIDNVQVGESFSFVRSIARSIVCSSILAGLWYPGKFSHPYVLNE